MEGALNLNFYLNLNLYLSHPPPYPGNFRALTRESPRKKGTKGEQTMDNSGARGEARTRDTRLKRAVLFLLSYTRK